MQKKPLFYERNKRDDSIKKNDKKYVNFVYFDHVRSEKRKLIKEYFMFFSFLHHLSIKKILLLS